MSQIEVAHRLEAGEVERRLMALAARHEVALCVEAPGRSGGLAKQVPFLGAIEARYEIRPGALAVEITRAPAALAARLGGLLAGELEQALR